MKDIIFYTILGYLLGTIHFAVIFSKAFKLDGVLEDSPDHNPGVANAYKYGSFACGTLTLIFDLAKGFVPVMLYFHPRIESGTELSLWSAAVLAAPVIGCLFPVFRGSRGGKGITVTFGCLLGLLPCFVPLVVLACAFIAFSTIIRIRPDFYKTIFSYTVSAVLTAVFCTIPAVVIGFAVSAASVGLKLLLSGEEKEHLKVGFGWMS
ncbi:MAG: glycerol-3-phosphate acyltransferase [Oscillospiraceae bacterium]|jgi:glycerol-3-phosphate acyltransferase PlsY